jgi:hypothetical protein
VNRVLEKVMENSKVEYSDFYLHAMQEIRKAHDALLANKFQDAYDHCLNAQVEIKLMSGAVRTWIPVKE